MVARTDFCQIAAVMAAFFLACGPALAQPPDPLDAEPASALTTAPLIPAGIDTLTQGDELRIVGLDAGETFGILQRLSPSTLTMATATGTFEIPLTELREVRRRGDCPWDGLLIGAAVGAALSAGTFVPCRLEEIICADNFTTTRRGDALVGAAVFGAIGLGIDMMHKGWRSVYTRRSGR